MSVWTQRLREDADRLRAGAIAKLIDRPPEPEERTVARRLFARVLDAPGGINILTIHAFCQALLKRFPLEAGVAPGFEVMDETDATHLLRQAQDDQIESLAWPDAPSELNEALTLVAGKVSVGDEIVVLPSGNKTTVRAIGTYDGPLPSAFAPQSIGLEVSDDVDIARGEFLRHIADLADDRVEALLGHSLQPEALRGEFHVRIHIRAFRRNLVAGDGHNESYAFVGAHFMHPPARRFRCALHPTA